MAAGVGDFLKPQDFLSPYCPYASDADAVALDDSGRQIDVLTDFAEQIERGAIRCEHIKNGKCAFAQFAIQCAIGGNESIQTEMGE